MYVAEYKLESERNTHDSIHDLTFSAHTFIRVRHSIRSMLRVLGIYKFNHDQNLLTNSFSIWIIHWYVYVFQRNAPHFNQVGKVIHTKYSKH